MYIDTLTRDAACKNGNISECLMNNSDIPQLWKRRARVFTPCITNYKYVSS